MSDISRCPYKTDYSWLYGFNGHLQVNASSNSPYSNLYLNPQPYTEWGLATLTSEPRQPWWMGGNMHAVCSRGNYLLQGSDAANASDIWSGLYIDIDATGHAPLNVQTEWKVKLQYNTTEAFYVESLDKPFSFNTEKPGSYFACTDDSGKIGVYYRRSNTTAYSGCEDILFNVLVG